VFNGGQPLLLEGSAANFDTALATIEQLSLQIVVPGHVPAGGPETLSLMRRYAQWLTDYASQFFQAGHPALEAARRAPLGEFPTWSARERLVANIERA
jgi:cyclase